MASGELTSSGFAAGHPGGPAMEPTSGAGAAGGGGGLADWANAAVLDNARTSRAAVRLACFMETPLGTEILYCPGGGSANYQARYTPFLIHCGLSICCIMKSATSWREMRLPLRGRASPSMR